MRWERLFDDLEAQFDLEERTDLEAEIADRTRREVAQLRLSDLVRAAVDRPLTLGVLGVGAVTGSVRAAGPDWVLLSDPAGAEAMVPLAAVTRVSGLGGRPAAPGPAATVTRRLGVGYVLRRIARDRSEVVVMLTDTTSLSGTVDRVGADFVEVVEPRHALGGRAREPLASWTVPRRALAAVRRSGGAAASPGRV